MPDRSDTAGERAARFRERAAEMRRQAATALTDKLRDLLLENAVLYDELAEQAERNGTPRIKGGDKKDR